MSTADDTVPPAGAATFDAVPGDTAPSTELAAPAEISVLKQKVMTAVRSAISETMVERNDAHALPPIDLDFSMPVAEPPPPLAVPPPPKPPLAEVGLPAASIPVYPRLETGHRISASGAALDAPLGAARQGRMGAGYFIIATLIVGALSATGALLVAIPDLRDATWRALDWAPEQPTKEPVKVATPHPPGAPQTDAAPSRPAAIVPPASQVPARLKALKAALAAGRIMEARKGLVTLANAPTDPATGAEIAFALARSYDRSYLATLANADGSADRKEAERWYRRWHALSVTAGTVSDGIVLERLVRSLQ